MNENRVGLAEAMDCRFKLYPISCQYIYLASVVS